METLPSIEDFIDSLPPDQRSGKAALAAKPFQFGVRVACKWCGVETIWRRVDGKPGQFELDGTPHPGRCKPGSTLSSQA